MVANETALFVNDEHITIDNTTLRITGKVVDNSLNGACVVVRVIRIKPTNDVAPAAGESLIESMCLSPVRRADPDYVLPQRATKQVNGRIA